MAVQKILLLMAVSRRKGLTMSTLTRPREEALLYSCWPLLRQKTWSLLHTSIYLSFFMSHFFIFCFFLHFSFIFVPPGFLAIRLSTLATNNLTQLLDH